MPKLINEERVLVKELLGTIESYKKKGSLTEQEELKMLQQFNVYRSSFLQAHENFNRVSALYQEDPTYDFYQMLNSNVLSLGFILNQEMKREKLSIFRQLREL